jgi:hypothetical protein
MQLASARDLKASMVQDLTAATDVARPQEVGIVAFEATSVDTLSTAATLALGVSPTSKRGDYRLAVRLQRRGAQGAVEAMDMHRRANGEVDLRYVGRIRKRTGFLDRTRPIQPGISVGHVRVTAGTLGTFVQTTDGSVRILSNNHVLADENQGVEGDDIVQPGTIDGGVMPGDRVGSLDRFIDLQTGAAANLVDCALAAIDDGVETVTDRPVGEHEPIGGVVDEDTVIDLVEKWGRTTGHTHGRVTAFELDNVRVGYDIGVVRFDDQLEIEATGAESFSDGGDSGSLIVTEGGRMAAALLFAGSQTGGQGNLGLTYANPIKTVLEALQVQLLS